MATAATALATATATALAPPLTAPEPAAALSAVANHKSRTGESGLLVRRLVS